VTYVLPWLNRALYPSVPATFSAPFVGGNFGSTQAGDVSSHNPSPVSLCLKSGDFGFF